MSKDNNLENDFDFDNNFDFDSDDNLDSNYEQILPPQNKIFKKFLEHEDVFPSDEFKEFNEKINLDKDLEDKVNKEFEKLKDSYNAARLQSGITSRIQPIITSPLPSRLQPILTSRLQPILTSRFQPTAISPLFQSSTLSQNRKKFTDFHTNLTNIKNINTNSKIPTTIDEAMVLRDSVLHQIKHNSRLTEEEKIKYVRVIQDGMCFALALFEGFNNRQTSIGTKNNPLGNMYNTLTQFVKGDKNIPLKDLEMIANYILAVQKSHRINEKFKEEFEQENVKLKKKYPNEYTNITYENHPINDGSNEGQNLSFVSTNINKKSELGGIDLQRVFNKFNKSYSLDDIDHILQPGVIFNLGSRTHAMNCFMDENKIISFYDPNDGKRFKFNSTEELKDHLKTNLPTKSAQKYFNENKFMPQIWLANPNTDEGKEISQYYANLEIALIQNPRDRQKLKENSAAIKKVCMRDLKKRGEEEQQRQAEEQKTMDEILSAITKKELIYKDDKSPIEYSLRKMGIHPFQYAIENNKEIDGINAIAYAIDNNYPIGRVIEDNWGKYGETFVKYAVDKNKKIDGQDPVLWTVKKKKSIEGVDPIIWAAKDKKPIEGMDSIIWAIDEEESIEGMNPIIWSVENNKTIGGEDALIWAINEEEPIEGMNPIIWAIAKQKLIEKQDPISWAAENEKPIEGMNAIAWAAKKGMQIDGEDAIIWALEEKKHIERMDPLAWVIENKKPIAGKDPITWAIENKKTIAGKDSLAWALNQGYITGNQYLDYLLPDKIGSIQEITQIFSANKNISQNSDANVEKRVKTTQIISK